MPGHGKRQGGQLAVPPKKKKKLRQSKDDARRVNGACALFAMRHALAAVLRREVTDMELVSALAAAANDAATKARDAPSRVEGEAMAVALADPSAPVPAPTVGLLRDMAKKFGATHAISFHPSPSTALLPLSPSTAEDTQRPVASALWPRNSNAATTRDAHTHTHTHTQPISPTLTNLRAPARVRVSQMSC